MIPYRPKILQQNYNVSEQSLISKSFEIIISLVVIVIIFAVIIYFSIGYLVSFAPVTFGKPLGVSFLSSFQAETAEPPAKINEELQNIFQKLKANLPEATDLELVVIPSADFKNAFALPGGIIVIGTGLINELKTEQEIAMILGHEIGHQINRDPLNRISKGALLILLYSSISFGKGDLPIASTLNHLIDLNFSRKQELLADNFGLKLLQDTYHSSLGAVEAFESILAMEKSNQQHENSYLNLDILKTHPDTELRIERLRKKLTR